MQTDLAVLARLTREATAGFRRAAHRCGNAQSLEASLDWGISMRTWAAVRGELIAERQALLDQRRAGLGS